MNELVRIKWKDGLRERLRVERERCAKVADASDKSTHPADVADAIRALSDDHDADLAVNLQNAAA